MSTATESITLVEAQRLLGEAEDHLTDRADYLQAIAFHELKLAELRSLIPSPLKLFFHYRTHPEKHVFVYAANREQATKRLKARLDKSYGPEGWRYTAQVVQTYNDPRQACAAAPCDLLTCLSETEGAEFVADYREHERGKAPDPNRPKHLPKSQLQCDIERWEKRQRMNQR